MLVLDLNVCANVSKAMCIQNTMGHDKDDMKTVSSELWKGLVVLFMNYGCPVLFFFCLFWTFQ